MSGPESVFERIRLAAAEVAARSTHVRIDHEGLAAFAARLEMDDVDNDPAHRAMGDDETTAAHVMTLDAINFGSGYFPYIRKRPGHSGYHTVEAALRDQVERAGPPTSAWLTSLTPAACAAVFDQPLDRPMPVELMGHFATALNDLGRLVDRVGGGTFLGVLDAAGGRAGRLLEILVEMPYFRDVHRYVDFDVPLYKRAQITAFDVAQAFDGTGAGRFDDLDQLTMFADNLVPHVLRVEGVLRFDRELVERIDAMDDIAVGSAPEIEIRAVGLHAVELLVAELTAGARPTTAGNLDGVLWRMGGAAKYKATPRHRTRCVYY